MKKYFSFILIGLIVILTIQPTYAKEDIQLHSEYAYLYDPITELVYIDKKSQDKIYPASMTKILTVSVAIEKIKDKNEKVRVNYEDLRGLIQEGASTAGFYEFELVTYNDLLYGALLPSGADACNTLGRLLFGNTQNMVEALNQKIKELNLKNTQFTNVTGLHDDNHYTTPREMAIILKYALQNKDFKQIFEAKTYTMSSQRLTWISSLQRGYEFKGIDTSFIDGGKSGYTDEAQLTFASTMTIDHHQLIFITAKANGQRTQNHVQDVITAYQYMSIHYKNYIIYKKDEEVFDYFVLHSWSFFNTYQTLEDVSILIEATIPLEDIQKEIKKESLLFADVQANTQIGTVKVIYNDYTLYQYPCLINQTISLDISAMIVMYGLISTILVAIIIIIKKKADA